MGPREHVPIRFTGEHFTGEYVTGNYAVGDHAGGDHGASARAGATWPLFLLGFLDTVATIVAGLRVPERVAQLDGHLGGADAAVGGVAAAFAVAQMVSALAWGRLSDRVGRRRVLLGGLLLSLMAALALATARSLAALVAARCLAGVASGTAGVVLAALADRRPLRMHARLLGRFTAATSLGAVVGPAIVMAFADGPVGAELVVAALAAIALPVAWRALPIATPSVAVVAATLAVPGGSDLRPVSEGSRTPLVALIAVYAIAIGAASGVPTMLPALLGPTGAAQAVMALGAAGFVMRATLVGPLAARLGEARMLGAGLLAIATALVLLCRPGSAVAAAAAGTLAFGTALAFPTLGALVARHAPPDRRGAAMGAQQAAGGAARAAFPLALGASLDAGRPAAALAACAATLVVAAGIALATAFAGRRAKIPAVRTARRAA